MGLIYVNAYAVSRRYGGPEEGGWWYDAGRPVASVPWPEYMDSTLIESSKVWLRKVLSEELEEHSLETVDRFSVCGDGEDLVICVEDDIATPYPLQRPHYE